MAEIRIENLTFTYPSRFRHPGEQVLKGITTTFPSGKFNVIIGQSGAGKTTLLRILLGLEDRYEGGIAFGKVNADLIPAKEREIGYVSQDISLYPHRTIFQNIAFSLESAHASSEEIRSRVFAIAELLGIRDLLSRKPRELSLGQNQRAAIARALIRNPRYCFFDEPFSNVDRKNADSIRKELRPLLLSRGITVLFVTHQVSEALMLGDRLFVMEDGKILEEGEPERVLHSQNSAVRAYFSEFYS